MTTVEIARSSNSCLMKAEDDTTASRIWFKSKPVDRTFCNRAAQLQLLTDSRDQGHNQTDAQSPGAWSWFEVVILPGENTEIPKKKDGRDLVWRSHGNRSDPDDTASSLSRCFGKVFDRKEEILGVIEVGDVIAVRVCVRYAGWVNDAQKGYLFARILSEDIFSPMSWTLSSATTPDIPDHIDDGVYTLISTTESHVKAKDSDISSEIWFTTPVLDEYIIQKIEDIQLFTVAYHQERVDNDVEDKWSWFDLVILANPEATVPRSQHGRSLVWRSHNVYMDFRQTNRQQGGKCFTSRDEILRLLKPGNVIGVRACAQFSKWETHALSGQLVVRISNKGPRRSPSPSISDWSAIQQENVKLQKKLENCLKARAGVQPVITSIESQLLGKELRADHKYGAGDRPLKLLSLDGGGVRGISCLYILKDIMERITGDPNAKPCDYFDMMAGTSTGGLIALMLGRLRMSVDQCIEAYERLATQIFGANMMDKVEDMIRTGARYSASALEIAVKEIIKEYAGDEEAVMQDSFEHPCKVFVVATRADDISNRVATHIRTYHNPNVEKSFAGYKIWEAARATSAAPTYFPRIKLGEYEYIDGGVGFNNPVLLLIGEARLYYGSARQFGCLVTLGTGISPNISLPPDGSNVFENIMDTAGVLKSMWELTMVGEQANEMAELLVTSGCYYRFNVGVRVAQKKWIEKVQPSLFEKWFGTWVPKEVDHFTPEDWAKVIIDLDDYKGMGTLIDLTRDYLKGEVPRLTECASKLPPKCIV